MQRRDLLVDGAAHERVHEVERAAGREHVDADQRVRARRRRGLAHAREGGRLVERGARTQHGHRPGDRERLGRQTSQPPPHGAPDALGPEAGDPGRVLRRAADVAGGQLVDQLAEQERVASGRAVTRRREAVDRLGEVAVHECGRRLLRERRGAQHACGGRRHQRVEELLVGPGLGRAGGRDEQHGDVLEALGQEHEPSKRRRVRPVQVVGHEQQRLLRRQVGDQPEQALQRAVEAVLGGALAVAGAEDGGSGLGASHEEIRRLRHLALERAGGPPRTRTPGRAPRRGRAGPATRRPPRARSRSAAAPSSRRLPAPRRPSARRRRRRPARRASAGRRAPPRARAARARRPPRPASRLGVLPGWCARSTLQRGGRRCLPTLSRGAPARTRGSTWA